MLSENGAAVLSRFQCVNHGNYKTHLCDGFLLAILHRITSAWDYPLVICKQQINDGIIGKD